MYHVDTIATLTDLGFLQTITGPVLNLDIETFSSVGFSGSVLQRVTVHTQKDGDKNFIFKQTSLEADWLSQRSQDTIGREAALLEEPSLQKLWQYLHCPYIAFAREDGAAGLLMEDLSAYLFPDVREPVDEKHEDIILNAITSVHASFWQSKSIQKLSWLARPQDYFELLRPGIHEQDVYCPPPDKIRNHIEEGWKFALQLVPSNIKEHLTQPAEEIFKPWQDLPRTLLHGDLKIANMAVLPSGKLSLFDWPIVGCAPAAMELGWYIAVNASRLSRSKEALMNKYRSCLEKHLSFTLQEPEWNRMKKLAIVTGAIMLLWSKALGLQSGTQKGKEEWEWWNENLKASVET